MKRYRLYLFDFDGTLVDSFPSLYTVFDRAYRAVGIIIDPKEVPQLSREPLSVGYYRLGGKDEDIKVFAKEIEDAVDSHETTVMTHLFDDSKDFFNYVKENNISCGIVTSNKVPHVYDVLDYLHIDYPSFVVFIGNKEVKHFKPHPEPVLKALEKLNYQGDLKDVVYVGDALNDVKSAIAAGVEPILLDRNNEYPESDNYIKIHSLLDLFK